MAMGNPLSNPPLDTATPAMAMVPDKPAEAPKTAPTKAETPRVVVVTGGMGFIGSNLVRMLLTRWPELAVGTPDCWASPPRVINVDVLTYAGNPANLADVADHERYRFVRADVADPMAMGRVMRGEAVPEWPAPDAVLHLAAESHVDRSISGPAVFLQTNVMGTATLLQVAQERADAGHPMRFVQVSTDEVYGDLDADEPAFTENRPLKPSSPYSASKAAADLLALAYARTHGLNVSITRCSNNYGPYQFPEKLIPLMTVNALRGLPLPVYGTGLNVRDWIHVDDHCRGLWMTLIKGRPGEVYHFGGNAERANLQVVKTILAAVGAPESLIRYVTDRKGHDRRYAMDFSRTAAELGWAPHMGFEAGLAATVAWYRDHPQWWEPLLKRR